MTILGAGLSPAGTTPAGVGLYSTAAAPLNAILPDLVTGLPQTGRLIDPLSKAYDFTSDGRLIGSPTVRQLVLLALTTLKGSAAISTLGQTFNQIQEKTEDFVQRVTTVATGALSDLIRRKLVALNGVVVNDLAQNPDAAACFIKWTDLTTGKTYTTPTGP